ncbi:hypothetical protein COCVIDRAFT_109982 [Bipolaris victoriae FI3]|uniref:Uncharacterized protein n=2 Tax=Bipolaris TaxID=33194 RepID=W6Y8P3_COCC2|nr:uncharacterized protein COCCADRAFT_100502 [Bipolaris zeicola 26-R-13]XP_014552568.1 hypothetical protein COCVIDRAFT_109982 [Bipolaris victoriae FI3]EUC31734.1 hypothetical protein COCCADRAFT_100502 [Bipolaris zeicola 26-R-13]
MIHVSPTWGDDDRYGERLGCAWKVGRRKGGCRIGSAGRLVFLFALLCPYQIDAGDLLPGYV